MLSNMMILLWTLQLVQVSTCFPLRRIFSCAFFLTTAIAGRYDGDVYIGLLERAQWSPLNKADVLPFFEKVPGRCRRRAHMVTLFRRSSRPTVPDSTVSWPPNFEACFKLNISFLAFATGNRSWVLLLPEMFLNHFEEFERARDVVNNRLF